MLDLAGRIGTMRTGQNKTRRPTPVCKNQLPQCTESLKPTRTLQLPLLGNFRHFTTFYDCQISLRAHEFTDWTQEHHTSLKHVKNRPTNSLIILDISYLSGGLRFYLDHGQRAAPLGMAWAQGPGPVPRAQGPGPQRARVAYGPRPMPKGAALRP